MNRHVLLLLLSQLIITRICESALGKPKFVYEKTKSPRILRGNGDDNDAGYKEESAYTTTTTDSSSDEEETEGSLDSQGESDTTHIVQDDNNDSSNGQKASESGTSERVHPLSSPGAGEGVNDQSRGDGARDGLGDESAEDGGNIDHVGEDSTGDNSKGDSSRQPTSMPSKRPSVGTVAPIVISEPPTSLPSVESIEFLPIAPRMPMFKPTPTPTPSLATTTTDTTVSPTKATTSFPSPVPASLEPTFLLVSANDGNADNRSGRGGENDEEDDDDDDDGDGDDDDYDEVGSHSGNDGSTGDNSKGDSSRQPTSMPSKRPSVDPFSADEGEEYNDDDYEGSYYGYQRNDEFWKDYFGDTGEQQSAPEEPSSGIEILLIYALLAGLVVWFAFGYIQRIFQSMFGGGNGYSLVDSNDTNRQRGAYPGFGSGDLEMTGYGGRTQRMEIYSPYR